MVSNAQTSFSDMAFQSRVASCTHEHASAPEMQICNHHIYELKKGLRDMVLITVPLHVTEQVCSRLQKKGISYHVQPVSDRKANVFFGEDECIRIVESFRIRNLRDITPEQDFILGVMLGYKLSQQYQRYLQYSGGEVE